MHTWGIRGASYPYLRNKKFTWDALFLQALYHRSRVQKYRVWKVVILYVSPMYKELSQGG